MKAKSTQLKAGAKRGAKAFTVEQLHDLLDPLVEKFNSPEFIASDPLQIPHSFKKAQDIEISAFFAAMLAWGQRKTIIQKCTELMDLMGNEPHDFVLNSSASDINALKHFKHRTFQFADLKHFISFFKHWYKKHHSFEEAFLDGSDTKTRLANFHNLFFDLPQAPARTRKHIATPERKSACKRLNMFLRWMVRHDSKGVDFGVWNKILPSELICPIDVHVERIARQLGLITRKPVDWLTAEELTAHLRSLDPTDPVKYDFALFGLGGLSTSE